MQVVGVHGVGCRVQGTGVRVEVDKSSSLRKVIAIYFGFGVEG